MKNCLRNIIFVTVIMMFVQLATGCSCGKPNHMVGENPEIGVVEPPVEVSNPDSPITSITIPDEEDEEPFLYFKVSEEWARKFTGGYLFSNNTYYSLNDSVDIRTFTGYGEGWQIAERNVTGMYMYSDMEYKHITMFGDFEIPVCTKDDELRSFDHTEFTFVKVHNVGYSAPIVTGSGDWTGRLGFIEDMSSSNITVVDSKSGNISQLSIKDGSGNDIEDLFNMAKDSECIISWYEGTDYNEVKLEAFCKVFELEEEEIKLEGELNENGYATYNTLKLPKGTYLVKETGGLVTVK